jgi:general secretion pathway protein D
MKRILIRLAPVCAGALALLLTVAQAQQRATGSRSSSSSTYSKSTQVGEAIISTDAETRKIIVVTDEDTAQQIGTVITNLDRPAPQVLIKVVFLEVTYSKGFDFGIEGSYSKNMGNSTTGVVNQMFGLANQGANPITPITSMQGAGIYQILGTDFQATLRAINEAGHSEVLSRPTVLARNNQQAIITVGQQVPLITNVRYDTFGNAINSVTYQSVGIILRVTPFITSNGMVEMVVNPEISKLNRLDGVQIMANVTAPVIDTRSADTVVVTPDGQTVVIGGLMQNTKTETDSKIPWLGDIPLLGNLFKHKIKSNGKTELLIFLTPKIVRQATELASMTADERVAAGPKAGSEQEKELDRFLDKVPSGEAAADKKGSKKSKR